MVGRMEEAMVQIIQYKDARVKIQRRRRSWTDQEGGMLRSRPIIEFHVVMVC